MNLICYRGIFMADHRDTFDTSPSRLTPTESQDKRSQPRVYLPLSFEPGQWDVICHNGREYQEHVGNKRFKLCVEGNLGRYSNANSRLARSAIISDIVNGIRAGGGGFVRYDQTELRWYDVGDKIARDKAGQAIRDSLRLRSGERKQIRPGDVQQRVETQKFDDIAGTQDRAHPFGESQGMKILAEDSKMAYVSGNDSPPSDLTPPPGSGNDTMGSAESSPDTLYQLSKEVTSVDSSSFKHGDPPSPEQWLALENIGAGPSPDQR